MQFPSDEYKDNNNTQNTDTEIPTHKKGPLIRPLLSTEKSIFVPPNDDQQLI